MKSQERVALVYLFFNKNAADAIRTLKFAKWLTKAGFRPVIITTSDAKISKNNDYEIIFLPGPVHPKLIAPYVLSFYLTHTLLKEKIHYCFLFIMSAAVAIIPAKLILGKQLKMIYDLQGLYIEEIDFIWKVNPLLKFIMKHMFNLTEQFNLKNSMALTGHNEIVIKYYQKKFPKIKKPMIEFSNAPQIKRVLSTSNLSTEIQQFINGRFSIVFVGRNQNWQGLQNLIPVIKQYLNPKICFVIIGFPFKDFGSYDHKLILNYENLDQKELYGVLSLFDAGIIPRDKNPVSFAASPTKFFEYLASGLLILSTDVGEVAHMIRMYDLWIYFKAQTI